MAVAMVQSCPAPSLHGRSRLSRSSGVAVPPPPPPPPVKWARTKIMSWSRAAHQASPRHAGTRSDDQHAGEKRGSPPKPSCISDDEEEPPLPPVKWGRTRIMRWSRAKHQASPRHAGTRSDGHQAGEKRRSPPWPSCISDDDDDDDEPPPLPVKRARTNIRIRNRVVPPPPPPVKKARPKIRSRRRDGSRATRLRLRLREWHNTIARLVLSHQFRAPELSRGRTALGCHCHELALADGGSCALHQDTREPEDRAWMYSVQGRVPLVGGPGEVLVPTLSAGNSKATVMQYARWRRGVRMPTRFYVENAAAQQRGMAAVDQQPEDDWMVAMSS